jgi:hypothetical protein
MVSVFALDKELTLLFGIFSEYDLGNSKGFGVGTRTLL